MKVNTARIVFKARPRLMEFVDAAGLVEVASYGLHVTSGKVLLFEQPGETDFFYVAILTPMGWRLSEVSDVVTPV